MTGPKYVWVMPGWFDDGWWTTPDPAVDCTQEQMSEAAEGYFTAADLTLSPDPEPGISGINSMEYTEEYDERTNHERPHASNMAPMMFDAIWALALALNETEIDLREMGAL